MTRTVLPPMSSVERCASCGIRKGNRLTDVREYDDELYCDKCVQEAARGATMVEDPEYLRPPGVQRDSLVGR